MKILIFLTFILSFGASAKSLSQNQKVSMEMEQATILEVLSEIKEQTGLYFIYKKGLFDDFEKTTFEVEDEKVKSLLDNLLRERGLECEVENEVITFKNLAKPSLKETQQDKKLLKGTVTDKGGSTLPGVSVVEKGTVNGVATDIDGNYSINIEDDNAVLVFSFVGMKPQEIVYAAQEVLDVTLLADAAQVDEVIVTGISRRKASTFTGAVSTFKAEELQAISSTNLFQSIKSLDPSIMIMDNMAAGSDPNAQPRMQVRGTSSFDLQSSTAAYEVNPNAPLFILNGFETTIQKVQDLDMDRVESITILKDAGAKAIYGSKAANGVIVIETKVNPGGKALVTYTSTFSTQVPDLSTYNLMDGEEKLQFEYDMGLYDSTYGLEDYMAKKKNVLEGVDTDWLSKPTRTSFSSRQRLGFEIGEGPIRLVAGFSYEDRNGVMKESGRDIYTGDLSITYRINKFKIQNELSIVSTTANDSPYGSFKEYVDMNPYYSPTDRDGDLVANAAARYSDYGYINESAYVANPLYNSKLNSLIQQKYFDVTNNLKVEYNFSDYLFIRGRLGVTIENRQYDTFYPAAHTMFARYDGNMMWRKGSYDILEGDKKVLSGDLFMDYRKTLGEKHFINSTFGLQMTNEEYKDVTYKAEGFPSVKMDDILFARQYTKGTKPDGSDSVIREFSGLMQTNYAYDNRFLFDGTLKMTGSSQYGANKRWGLFWSLGAGWNVHNEPWMESLNIQELKLRASVGTTGARAPVAYAGISAYTFETSRGYKGQIGAQLMSMRNADLKWQEKMDQNIGIDLTLFKKFNLTFDYYNNLTKNSIINKSLPPSNGFVEVQENVGEIENKGFDLSVSYTAWQKSETRSNLVFTCTVGHNENMIKSLSSAMKEYNQRINDIYTNSEKRQNSSPLQKFYEGVSMNAIWAMKSNGIDPSNGMEVFVKKDGTTTYEYLPEEQQIVGNSLPDYIGNLGMNFQHNGFGVNVGFYYRYGGQVYNYTLAEKVEAYDLRYNVDKRVLKGQWQKPGDVKPYRPNPAYYLDNDNAVIPDFIDIGNGTMIANNTNAYYIAPTSPTERFMFDDNYVSLSNVSISYDFWRHNFIKKLGLSRLKFVLGGNNLYEWSSVDIERGTDYPFARTFTFAITATF